MSKARKTIVRHEDGTVSTRGSQRAIYTHAVEVVSDKHAEADRLRATAEDIRREQAEAAALRPEDARFERRPWGFGERKTERVTVWGDRTQNHYLGAYVVDTDGEGFDVAGALAARVEMLGKSAAAYDERAAILDEGPQYAYGVYRWSASRANAEKGAREVEGRGFARVRIVEVEEA